MKSLLVVLLSLGLIPLALAQENSSASQKKTVEQPVKEQGFIIEPTAETKNNKVEEESRTEPQPHSHKTQAQKLLVPLEIDQIISGLDVLQNRLSTAVVDSETGQATVNISEKQLMEILIAGNEAKKKIERLKGEPYTFVGVGFNILAGVEVALPNIVEPLANKLTKGFTKNRNMANVVSIEAIGAYFSCSIIPELVKEECQINWLSTVGGMVELSGRLADKDNDRNRGQNQIKLFSAKFFIVPSARAKSLTSSQLLGHYGRISLEFAGKTNTMSVGAYANLDTIVVDISVQKGNQDFPTHVNLGYLYMSDNPFRDGVAITEATKNAYSSLRNFLTGAKEEKHPVKAKR